MPNLIVRLGTKIEFDALLRTHHYLKDTGYRVGVNVVLEDITGIIGVAIFTNFPVPEVGVGLYGVARNDQQGFYELSRFCLHPDYQVIGQNYASWFLARAIDLLRRTHPVRALLSYADSAYHRGVLYQASNFKYYGLTAPKKDFKKADATLPNSRGCGGAGQWVERTRKHRYLITYDKKLTPKWVEQPYPKADYE